MARVAEARVAEFLGGSKVLGGLPGVGDFIEVVRQGLPYASLEALSAKLRSDPISVANVVGIAPRTMARRKHEKVLSPIESDRLYRVAYVVHLAASTLGDLDKARLWLQRPNRALAGVVPLAFIDTEIGARKVEQVLLQMTHGIYA